MSSFATGIFIVVALLALLATGMPIAFALGLTALLAVLLFLGPAQLDFFGDFVFNSLNNFTLLAIPLFIFMGAVFGGSKASEDLFEAGHMWLSRVRGGLAMSSVVASALFAALCGSSAATAAAIGKVAIPEMRKRGYTNRVSTGAVVAGGTLGILIPPSVTLILYGIATEQSIGQLFMGGVVPGLLITLFFCVWISIAILLERRGVVAARSGTQEVENIAEVESFPWKERFKILLKVVPFIALIAGVLGALYLGFATPSEAAAVGAFLALVLVTVMYRSMTWKRFSEILLESTGESTMVMMIVAFSAVLGTVMSFLAIPQDLALLIAELEINRWWIMFIINVFLLVLGFFLPPVSIILMVTPVLFPIITALEFDPIWFGVIMTINMEMGLITPPVGLNLYVVKGIAPDIPLSDILIGSIPYVVILGLSLVFFSFFPGLITWLPETLFAR
ncbi:C4-dicarboxylate ABC transporter [Rubrobacter xylanophilus]|uniref:C4-dicarboxylate ABC transporter n=1 Tax=Rubrobacter xylanophilus TaxID=49319 RepID=A0A510HJP9_9ACTN|nr:TRAP transporter large permease [Rubrobacter xylanophilus]BBL80241.1 C4-dicarboxylate ABC transporter [Rubrobacter xylanophilus]